MKDSHLTSQSRTSRWSSSKPGIRTSGKTPVVDLLCQPFGVPSHQRLMAILRFEHLQQSNTAVSTFPGQISHSNSHGNNPSIDSRTYRSNCARYGNFHYLGNPSVVSKERNYGLTAPQVSRESRATALRYYGKKTNPQAAGPHKYTSYEVDLVFFWKRDF